MTKYMINIIYNNLNKITKYINNDKILDKI